MRRAQEKARHAVLFEDVLPVPFLKKGLRFHTAWDKHQSHIPSGLFCLGDIQKAGMGAVLSFHRDGKLSKIGIHIGAFRICPGKIGLFPLRGDLGGIGGSRFARAVQVGIQLGVCKFHCYAFLS